MSISEKIFSLLDERGMSQREFSRKTGITQSTISDWKRKNTNPSADKIIAICDVLKVSPYELLQEGDSNDELKKVDYRMVSKGTDTYQLIIDFESLNHDNKQRLLGYLSALKDLQ
ncbi:MAG: helix-turn-helix transcriptional regulator [Butyrivibrio sp.]|nr:helix-turn-helix transcriptional regulator [Butyrivibrio sp.]MBE5829237.1 helix-turn-helix transcriptional regulator [Butyrivibrio sp.]